MKKGLFLLSLIVTFYALGTVSASAVTNDTVKVGLRYGSSVMSSANLENDEGSGYEFGYFEDDRTFVSLGETDETAITMEPAGRDGIQVTITGTDRVLYESREDTLAVMPQGRDPVTWFRGNRYRGGFEYTVSGGGLQVVNVVDLEDYVKGVLPSEMPGNWELEALKAQAVCARTFACLTTKHLSAYGFDVCSSTDCQAYSGIGEATSATDRAVEETEGECLYYDGELAQAYYHSSDGGATEDAENVWGTDVPYLRGKEDPYEAQIDLIVHPDLQRSRLSQLPQGFRGLHHRNGARLPHSVHDHSFHLVLLSPPLGGCVFHPLACSRTEDLEPVPRRSFRLHTARPPD